MKRKTIVNKITQEVTVNGTHKKVVSIIHRDGKFVNKEVHYEYDDSNDNTVNLIDGEVINAYNGNHKALLVACIFIVGLIIFGVAAII